MLASSCEDTFDWEAASSCGVPHSWMNGSAGVPAVPATISMSEWLELIFQGKLRGLATSVLWIFLFRI
jgi:hypothetical protein